MNERLQPTYRRIKGAKYIWVIWGLDGSNIDLCQAFAHRCGTCWRRLIIMRGFIRGECKISASR